MPSIIKSRGARVAPNILSAGGTNPGIPEFVFPGVSQDLTAASALYAAFTMTGTSGTLASTSEGVITPTNCTLRESYNTKPHIGGAVLLAATARRKPGTTGSIAAQSVVFTVNSVEIGRFSVPATSAGLDPECGYVCFYNSAGDTRVDLATYSLTIGVTAADPDLEIVVWIVGNQD